VAGPIDALCYHVCRAWQVIGGTPTDIIVTPYEDRIMLVLSQTSKFGTLVSATRTRIVIVTHMYLLRTGRCAEPVISYW
jgi:hypothetical protein